MTERDDVVSKRYRELPAEEPSRALDEAILAASRRAAGARPAPLVAPAGRQRWYVPLAAAAVIVLAVGLTLRVQLEKPEVAEEVTPASPTVLKDEAKPQKDDQEKAEPKAAPEALARQAAPQSGARDKLESSARSKVAESGAQGSASGPSPFPAQTAPAPAAPPAAAEPSRNVEPKAMSRGPAAEAPAPVAAPKSAAPPPPAAQMREMRAAPRADDATRDRAESELAIGGATAKRQMEAPETPEKMLERIAELRKAGKDDEADKALAEFRKRFPEYKLSDEMRAKVERAKAVSPAR